MKQKHILQKLVFITASLLAMNGVAANPQGATIVNGQVIITSPSGNVLNITNTPGAIINWQSFGINPNEVTRFIQQSSSSAILNRVVGQDPSQIMGSLLSNGKVFLVNPNGIVFGANSIVDTAGLIASSLNMSNQDFLEGNLKFEGGPSSGDIQSQGYITAGKNGDIFLIAPNIENSGIIETDGGRLILAAGEKLTIASLDSESVGFEVQAPENNVVNLGELITNGGAASIFAGTITHSGSINADSVTVDKQGQIVLAASHEITVNVEATITANGDSGGSIHIESEAGTTWISGTVQATGIGNTGGKIEILGENVGLINSAAIDASGETGGGEVLIGGDYLGENADVKNAKGTYVAESVEIKADAITDGDGGKVIVWSDEATRMYGQIFARGGAEGGNGGFIETSGAYLDLGNYVPDASSPFGMGGEWLIDPFNLTIQAAGPDTNVDPSPNFTANAGGAILTTGSIETALNNGTSVTASTGTGAGTGTIYIEDDIAKTTGGDATLTFEAVTNITRNTAGAGDVLNITSTSGMLNLVFDAPTTTFGGCCVGLDVTVNLDANGGTVSFNDLTGINTSMNVSGVTTFDKLTAGRLSGISSYTFNDNVTATDIITSTGIGLYFNGTTNTADNVTLTGILGGTGKLTVSTLLNTSSAASGAPYIMNSVELETLAGSTTNIATDLTLRDTAVWNNSGTVNWNKTTANPRFYINNTSIFSNLAGGVFNDNTSGTGQSYIGGQNTAQFVNAGTFNKLGTSILTGISTTPFVNTGNVVVAAGATLSIGSSVALTDSGDYLVGAGGNLYFSGQRAFSSASSITSSSSVTLSPAIGQNFIFPSGYSLSAPDLTIGSGNVIFDAGSTLNLSNSLTTNGGNVTVNTANFTLPSSITIGTGSVILNSGIANPTISNLTMSSATLQGTDDLTVTNLFNWSGGRIYTDINNTGTTNITGNVRIDEIFTNSGTMNIGADYSSDDGSLINNATVNWTAGDIIELGSAASITNNGTFNISGNTANGINFTNNGTFSKTAGAGTTSFTGSFLNTDTVNASSGLLQFNGYTQTAGLTKLAGGNIDDTGGTSNINGGTLAGIGSFTAGDLNVNGATLSPGASPGTLNIVGNLNLGSTSTTLIELGGTNQGVDYDFINVTGNVVLDGTLNVSLFGGFTGSAGNQFDIIRSGTSVMTGSFATSNFPTGYNFGSSIFNPGSVLDYRLEILGITSTTPSTTLPSISIDEILVLEENFGSWTLEDIVFADDTTEEYNEQALICS